MTVLLGLDYGTSSFKAGLFDPAGTLLALTGAELAVTSPQPGWVEQDAAAGWQAVCSAIRQLLQSTGLAPESVAAVAATGSAHLTLLDEAGHVLRPAILYGDTRLPPSAEVETIIRDLGEQRVAAAFGLPTLDEARLPFILRVLRSAKLLWLRAHEPDVFNRLRVCLSSSADLVNFRLTGQVARLAGAVPLDDDITALFGLPRAWFGTPRSVGAVVGHVTPAAAQETGLAVGTPVIMAGIDSLVAFLGAGLARPGLAANLAGTTDVVGVTLSHPPRTDGAGYAVPHLITGLWLLSLSPLRGPALSWFRDRFLPPGAGPEAIGALAADAPLGAGGLLFLPYLAGEKGIIHDPGARGVLAGLDLRHDSRHIARALLEGIAFGLRDILDAYQARGAAVEAVRLGGGGARSRLWNQIKADVLDRPVEVLHVCETGCLGSAMLAAVAAGRHSDLAAAASAMVRVAETIAPRPEAATGYREVYAIYHDLYPANQALLARLVRWRGEKESP